MRDRLVRFFLPYSDGNAVLISCEGRFELFLDLLYVAILANFAENLAEHVNGNQLVKYIVSHHLSCP